MILALSAASLALMQAASPIARPAPKVVLEPAPRQDRILVQAPARTVKPNLPPAPLFTDTAWVGSSEYPIEAKREGRSGSTTVRLDITQWGRVADCIVLSSSGHTDLDERACSSIARHKQFEAATDANAKPISGTIEHTVHWRLKENGDVAEPASRQIKRPPFPDMMATTSLPKPPRVTGRWDRPTGRDHEDAQVQDGRHYRVVIALAISPEGTISGCEVTKPAKSASVNDASCQLADRIEKITPALDVDGNPTAGRVERIVRWYAPSKQTTVVSRAPFSPRKRPVSMPDLGSGSSGFTMETDPDGKVIKCDAIREGNVPDKVNMGVNLCKNAKERGVETVTNDAGEKVGRKIRVEVRMSSEKTTTAKTED